MSPQDQTFVITKEVFDKYYSPLKAEVDAKYFYQIGLGLQFKFPAPDDLCLASHAEHGKFGKYGIMATFKQVKIRTEVESSIKSVGFAFFKAESEFTYSELIIFSSSAFDGSDSDALSAIAVEFLNSILISYSFLARDTTTFLVNKQNLKSPVFAKVFTDWRDDAFAVAILNFNSALGLNDKTLNHAQIEDIQRVMSVDPLHNPILTSQEIFAYDALINYRNGRMRESVVSIQSSIESFLIRLYAAILIEEKQFQQQMFENNVGAYKNFINHHLTKKLNVSWNWNDAQTEFGLYNLFTYQMRNRIIHEGYEPTLKEANESIKAGLEFREYVISIVRRSQYQTLKIAIDLFYFNRGKSFAKDVFDTWDDFHFDRLKEYGKDSDIKWIWSERPDSRTLPPANS
ncbi:MAG TPA: hypothetical protein VK658_06655 [Chryseolinea sp.]|nr:hypothetical protein [Chryseolinea sp.]